VDTWLLGGTFLLAVLDWMACMFNWTRLRWFTKPATLLALTLWFRQVTSWQGPALWFGLGLVFSLLGDIFLLLPRSWFLVGLTAFLTAQILYIASLNPTPPPFPPAAITVAALMMAWALVFYRVFRAGLARIPGNRRLRIGVGIYSLVLTLMLISAILTLFRTEWETSNVILVICGALLFYTSDSLLAYDRFVRPVRYGRVLVMVTYHLGQVAMAVGMAMQLVGSG